MKTTEKKAIVADLTEGKKVKGRKRHIAVDVMGMLLGVLLLPANFSDDFGAKSLFERIPFVSRWALFLFDGDYEQRHEVSESMIYMSMTPLMLKPLHPN